MASLQSFCHPTCTPERHRDKLSLVVLYLAIAQIANKLVSSVLLNTMRYNDYINIGLKAKIEALRINTKR